MDDAYGRLDCFVGRDSGAMRKDSMRCLKFKSSRRTGRDGQSSTMPSHSRRTLIQSDSMITAVLLSQRGAVTTLRVVLLVALAGNADGGRYRARQIVEALRGSDGLLNVKLPAKEGKSHEIRASSTLMVMLDVPFCAIRGLKVIVRKMLGPVWANADVGVWWVAEEKTDQAD